MAWVHIKSKKYDGSSGSGHFEVQVHYDDASDTATRMKIKLSAKRLGNKNTSYSSNGYYLLVNPGADSEKLYTLKAPGDNWDESASPEITLTKTYTSANFTIPMIWICNTGEVTPNLTTRQITYKDGTYTMYNLFNDGGKRESYVTEISSSTKSGITASAGSATISISDLGTNKFRISGTITAGSNNAFKSATVYYTTNGSTPTTSSTSKTPSAAGPYSFDIDVPSSSATSKINAKIISTFTYNAPEATATETTVKYHTDGGGGSVSITDNKNNTFTISGKTGKQGTNNSMTKANLYYTIGSAAKQTVPLTAGSERVYSCTVSVPSTADTHTVTAYVTCEYAWGSTTAAKTKTSTSATQAVKYYTDGGDPSITAITDNNNNTFTISGNVGANGTNNTRSGSTLYYTTNGDNPALSTSARTKVENDRLGINSSTKAFSYTANIPARNTNGNTTIRVYVVSTFPWGTSDAAKTRSKTSSESVQYHSNVTEPRISITDNGNNTFTITGTDSTSGINNSASTSYAWGYSDSNYDKSGKGTKDLTIATPSDDTRTVYVKATATASWENDSAKKVSTASLAIKQYVAPGDPGKPVLHENSYKNGRLTVKQKWTYTWTAAAAANASSPICGYRIRIFRKAKGQSDFAVIPNLINGTDNRIVTGTSAYLFVDRNTTATTITFDPVELGFEPGDAIKVGVHAYTVDGTNTWMFNTTRSDSVASVVQNAGIVNVKVNGAWKEGQVYVKIKGEWKEAETVNVKVKGVWKEST